MTLAYGFVKGAMTSAPVLKATRRPHETQYHLHFGVRVNGMSWDVAINVGTSDADDLLKYKLVYDFRHPIVQTLAATAAGAHPLTGQTALPALDYMRGDVLSATGNWRESAVMDGSDAPEPVASLKRLFVRAQQGGNNVHVFGRIYKTGDGIHDTHMNQGSTGSFLHRAGDDSNDHNDIWQDGAVLVDIGAPEWVAYFAAFNKQLVPTDNLGNPAPNAGPI